MWDRILLSTTTTKIHSAYHSMMFTIQIGLMLFFFDRGYQWKAAILNASPNYGFKLNWLWTKLTLKIKQKERVLISSEVAQY